MGAQQVSTPVPASPPWAAHGACLQGPLVCLPAARQPSELALRAGLASVSCVQVSQACDTSSSSSSSRRRHHRHWRKGEQRDWFPASVRKSPQDGRRAVLRTAAARPTRSTCSMHSYSCTALAYGTAVRRDAIQPYMFQCTRTHVLVVLATHVPVHNLQLYGIASCAPVNFTCRRACVCDRFY
jgi:hypothetical protein